MKKLTIITMHLAILAVCLFSSCGEETEEAKQMPIDKHGTCIVEINQYNTEKYTILTYTDSVYKLNGNFLGIISHKDTLPSLGVKNDTLETERIITDENGDERYADTVITNWRRYQMFINLSKNAN